MATVGELVVNLTARTARFNRGMQNAQRRTTQFGRATDAVTKKVLAFGAGFLALGTLTKVAGMIKRTADEIDRLAKVSRKLGTTVEELQTLRFAAQKAGIATTTLDMALQRMTRRAAEAAIGTGEAKAAIAELGIDAKKLSTAGPYRSMLMLADAFERVENPAQRLRLAFKLFDSEGVELVNVLEGGSAGLKELHDRMERVRGVTTDSAKAIEHWKDVAAEAGLTPKGLMQKGVGGWAMIAKLHQRFIETGDWFAYEKELGLNKLGAALKEFLPKTDTRAAELLLQRQEDARKRFDSLLARIRGDLAGKSPLQRLIADAKEFAEAAKLAKWETDAFLNVIKNLNREGEKRAAAVERLRERGQELAARMGLIKSLIMQEIRGGDGASLQLPGTAPPGSREFYSMMVRRGLQKTGERTNEQIAERVAKLLAVEEKTDGRIADIYEILADMGVIREVHF